MTEKHAKNNVRGPVIIWHKVILKRRIIVNVILRTMLSNDDVV